MSLSKLPSEVLYDIIGYVVADYIDICISSPPRPSYLRPWSPMIIDIVRNVFSQRRSTKGTPHPVTIGSDKTEWSDFTEHEFAEVLHLLAHGKHPNESSLDEQDCDKKPQVDERRLAGDRNTEDQDEAVFDADDERDDEDEESDENEESEDDDDDDDDDDDGWEDEDEENSSEEHSSLAPIDTDYEIDSEDSDSDTVDETWGHDENGVTAEFRQWEAIEASEKLPESAIQPLLSVNGMIQQVTLKVVYDALGIKRDKKGKRSVVARSKKTKDVQPMNIFY